MAHGYLRVVRLHVPCSAAGLCCCAACADERGLILADLAIEGGALIEVEIDDRSTTRGDL